MIYVHTLAFNLPSEVEDATQSLYELNTGFKHLIADLGFPLEYGGDLPEDIDKVKKVNSKKLQDIASKYGSEYVNLPNIGVSQNWNQVKEYFGITDKDILICADPDERPFNKGWVNAIYTVLSNFNLAACALVMPDQKKWLENNHGKTVKVEIGGKNVFLINGTLSMAQVGFSGKFLNMIGGVPVPESYSIYGHIESALNNKMKERGYGWGILQDYEVIHTECSTLYREWKTDILSGNFIAEKQIGFESWLELKINKPQ